MWGEMYKRNKRDLTNLLNCIPAVSNDSSRVYNLFVDLMMVVGRSVLVAVVVTRGGILCCRVAPVDYMARPL